MIVHQFSFVFSEIPIEWVKGFIKLTNILVLNILLILMHISFTFFILLFLFLYFINLLLNVTLYNIILVEKCVLCSVVTWSLLVTPILTKRVSLLVSIHWYLDFISLISSSNVYFIAVLPTSISLFRISFICNCSHYTCFSNSLLSQHFIFTFHSFYLYLYLNISEY